MCGHISRTWRGTGRFWVLQGGHNAGSLRQSLNRWNLRKGSCPHSHLVLPHVRGRSGRALQGPTASSPVKGRGELLPARRCGQEAISTMV